MNLTSGILPRVVEIKVSGNLSSVLERFPEEFENLIQRLSAEGFTHYLVGLDVEFMNSLCFAALAMGYKRASESGGGLAVYIRNRAILGVIRQLKCPRFFYKTRDGALCYLLREVPSELEA